MPAALYRCAVGQHGYAGDWQSKQECGGTEDYFSVAQES